MLIEKKNPVLKSQLNFLAAIYIHVLRKDALVALLKKKINMQNGISNKSFSKF